MKKGTILLMTLLAMGLWMMGCSSEEGTHPDTADTPTEPRPDTPPDTLPDYPIDNPIDTPIDTPIDYPVDYPVDNPIEIIPDGTGTAYGTVNVNFNTPFLYDYDQLSNEYVLLHPEGLFMTPVFTGTFGSGKTIPGADAVATQAYGTHVPAGTYPAAVSVVQTSFADTSGSTYSNPAVEFDFASDAITTGSNAVGMMTGNQAGLALINITGPSTYCILALADGGTVNVTTATNTTATEGGSLAFSGTGIPVYHPTNTPYGDVTSQLSPTPVCPIE